MEAKSDGDGRHRLVFDLAVADPAAWAAVLRNAANARQALGPDRTEVAVVAYGPGLGFLLDRDAADLAPIAALAAEGVAFMACRNSLRAAGRGEAELAPGAVAVDSGVAELTRRQERGWAYIKVVGGS